MLWAKINFLLLLHMSHQTASDKYDVDVILESTAISVDFGGHHREIGDLCTQIGDNSGFCRHGVINGFCTSLEHLVFLLG